MCLRPALARKIGVFSAFAVLGASSAAMSAAHAADPTATQPRVLKDDVVPATERARHLGKLPHGAYLRLAFTLVTRNRPDLDRFVTELDDPGSPRYRRYLQGSEFSARYGRTIGEIDRLRSFLVGQGFHIDDVHSGHLLVDASATAADVERAFGIRLDTWRDTGTGRLFYGNLTPPTLPADPGLLVADIAGLNDRAVRAPAAQLGQADGLTPAQLRTAYRPASLDRGEKSIPRTRVALVEFAGFRPQDLAEYRRRFALTSPPPELHLVDGGPDAGKAEREAVEAQIETVQALAPTTTTEVFTAENSPAGEIDAFQGVVDAGITVAMTAWTSSEEQRTRSGMQAIDLVLEEGAAEGIGFYAAYTDPGGRASGRVDSEVDFPASDPHVTAVGATDDAGGDTDGGHGRSTVFAQPWWQARWGGRDPRGRREVPDVTARVGPGVVVFTSDKWRTANGAGIATALATALATLHDQDALTCREPPLGFAAPTLYRLAHEGTPHPEPGTMPGPGPWPVDLARVQTMLSCQKRPQR